MVRVLARIVLRNVTRFEVAVEVESFCGGVRLSPVLGKHARSPHTELSAPWRHGRISFVGYHVPGVLVYDFHLDAWKRQPDVSGKTLLYRRERIGWDAKSR